MARAANDLSLNPAQRSALRAALVTRVKDAKGGCVLWTGSCNIRTGAPVMVLKGQFVAVTRAVFLLKSKKLVLSGDTSIKTTCGHPNCLNPAHLVGVLRRFQMLPVADAIAKSAKARASTAAKAGVKAKKVAKKVPASVAPVTAKKKAAPKKKSAPKADPAETIEPSEAVDTAVESI